MASSSSSASKAVGCHNAIQRASLRPGLEDRECECQKCWRTSCDLLILVEEAAEVVVPLDGVDLACGWATAATADAIAA